GPRGEIAGVLGTAFDVTELRRRIRRLSESEQRLQLALEGSGMVGIWTLDVASGTSTADASVARMYGLPVEICAQGVDQDVFLQAIHPEDRQRVRASQAQSIASGAPHRCRYRIVDADQQVRWVIA